MVIPVHAFGEILTYNIVGQMAFDAGSSGMMAGLSPRIVLRLHDMAIGAYLGFGTRIRKPFGIKESKGPDAQRNSNSQGNRISQFIVKYECKNFVKHAVFSGDY